jgi:hypothetical protein
MCGVVIENDAIPAFSTALVHAITIQSPYVGGHSSLSHFLPSNYSSAIDPSGTVFTFRGQLAVQSDVAFSCWGMG